MNSVGNQVVITIDRSLISIDSLNKLFERLRLEELIKKANFSEEVLEIGKEIKSEWWQKNKKRYLEGISDVDSD
jgi:hypothetical protein